MNTCRRQYATLYVFGLLNLRITAFAIHMQTHNTGYISLSLSVTEHELFLTATTGLPTISHNAEANQNHH